MKYNMKNIDLSILGKDPDLSASIKLHIEPHAPISMVSELPGSYYKALLYPDKHILCGLFENVLGWHFSRKDREIITKEIKNIRKKSKKGYIPPTIRSIFIPLLSDFFELDSVRIVSTDSPFFYNDLWKRAFRRKDAGKIHFGGTQNIDYTLVMDKFRFMCENERALETEEKTDQKEEKFLRENIDRISFFYTTPTNREYLFFEGNYECVIKMDPQLVDLLSKTLPQQNMGYLGNSEGWVTLYLEEKS